MQGVSKIATGLDALSPSTQVAFFIERGHIMEVIDLRLPDNKIVALFIGPTTFDRQLITSA